MLSSAQNKLDYPQRVIAIFGMPRSGTSFVGQIIDSCPIVAYRMEPIFSYKLKNIVDEKSSKDEYVEFFRRAFNEDNDEFMNQLDKRKKGLYPNFNKTRKLILAFKTTRFHQLIPSLLSYFKDNFLKIISVVRHPAGAIYSWINTPKEFPPNLCNVETDWLTGRCRKTSEEEFWGFEDWKKVTKLHLEMEKKYRNFKIFQYENIVFNTKEETLKMFSFLHLPYTDQTDRYIRECNSVHIDDPYAVYKNRAVANKWKRNLDRGIIKKIVSDIKNTPLERFLVEY